MKQDRDFQPLFLMFLCFVVVIFSINQIINMAKPIGIAAITAKFINLKSDPYYKEVKTFSQSPGQLSYKDFQSKLSVSYSNQSAFSSATFGIDPQIEKLPINEQNYLIRFKLLEWQLEQMQNQQYEISKLNTEPLIFKIGFWIYAFLTWVGSVFFGRILTHYTDKFIQKHC